MKMFKEENADFFDIFLVVMVVLIAITLLFVCYFSSSRYLDSIGDKIACQQKGGTLIYTNDPYSVCVKTIPLEGDQ